SFFGLRVPGSGRSTGPLFLRQHSQNAGGCQVAWLPPFCRSLSRQATTARRSHSQTSSLNSAVVSSLPPRSDSASHRTTDSYLNRTAPRSDRRTSGGPMPRARKLLQADALMSNKAGIFEQRSIRPSGVAFVDSGARASSSEILDSIAVTRGSRGTGVASGGIVGLPILRLLALDTLGDLKEDAQACRLFFCLSESSANLACGRNALERIRYLCHR